MRVSGSLEPAKVWISEHGTVKIRAPYQPSFVSYLKQFPKSKRRWLSEEKIWEVEYELLRPVLSLLHQFYREVIVIETGLETKGQTVDGWTRLRSLITADDLSAIHRLLAKRHHPDTGGSSQRMTEINSCFEEINKI